MTTTELEQVIREYIKTFAKKEYIGKMKVEKLERGYYITLGMNVPECPTTIYVELEGEDLLKFLKREIKDRCFHLKSYGELKLTYPSCYDERRNY